MKSIQDFRPPLQTPAASSAPITLTHSLPHRPDQTGAAAYAFERSRLHQELTEALARLEYGIKAGLVIVRDSEGAVIESLAGLIAAEAAGEWPVGGGI